MKEGVRVRFRFQDDPVTQTERNRKKWNEIEEINHSLFKKTKKVFNIPYLPCKGMCVNILTYSEILDLTIEEIEWLAGDIYNYFYIKEIWMEPEFIVLELRPHFETQEDLEDED